MRAGHAILAVAAALSPAPRARAFEFHGYFRDTVAFNSNGGGQVCFQLPSSEFKARLGNECDHYWELSLSETVYKSPGGVEAKVEFMPAYGVVTTQPAGAPGFGYGTGSVFTAQAWGYVKLPQLGNASIWAGQRYYRRHNVESADWFYWNPYQGNVAAGIEGVGAGIGKLAFAVGRAEAVGTLAAPANVVTGTYVLPEARIYDIPVNPNGALEIGVDVAVAFDQDQALGEDRARVGPWVTVEHAQEKVLGGFNRITFQYGSGAVATMRNTVLSGADSSPRQWRIIEQLTFFPVARISGQLFLLYQDLTDLLGSAVAEGSGARIFTSELRPAWHFTDYFKIQLDAFFQTLSVKGSSDDPANLLKLTLAPTLVAGRGFLARPEVRVFATWGVWNAPAAALGTTLGTPIASDAFGSERNGFVFGVHVEAWW